MRENAGIGEKATGGQALVKFRLVMAFKVVAGFRGCCRTFRLKTKYLSHSIYQGVNEIDVEGDLPSPSGRGREARARQGEA